MHLKTCASIIPITFLCRQLPCQIDIIKHPLENDGKSTATHARLVAPEAVQIYTYPHFPDYDRDGVTGLD